MEDYLEKSKCLASLAVFRELHDSQKDIYGIIAEFLKEVIVSKAKYQFTLIEIAQLLNASFDFSIPEAVIKTSLNRLTFLVKSQGVYTVESRNDLQNTANISSKQSEIQQNNNLIIKDLFKYVEAVKKISLTETEKKIVHSFCSFILDESITQEYSEFISAFIIKNKSNSDFTSKLSTIKEGVVLYSGLKYNMNLSELGTWNTDLTIFIETEILFHLAGYNGEVFKTLYNDFYSFVREINQTSQKKNSKKRIQLKYFTEVKEEIERFFKKAEYILKGQDKANPSVTAMATILDGCQTASDLISKKIAFYQLLKSNGIQEDDYTDYYDIKNHQYNIEDQSVIEAVSTSTGIEDITNYLKFLNYISIHRKEASVNNFENIGYILLTGNAKTISVAFSEEIKPAGGVPLATTLNFLTNKFWFKLNKGFGDSHYPKNFDIITKAQIVISTQLNNTVGKKYDELQSKFKSGHLTEQQAVATIVELRRQSKRPEEIDENVVTEVLVSISESSIENYLQEQEIFRNRAQKQEEENKKLTKEITAKDKEIEQKKVENEEKEKELKRFREAEKKKQEASLRRKEIVRKSLWILLLLILIASGVLLYNYLNKTLGIITTTIAGVLTILNFFGINYKTFMRTNK